MDLVLFAKLEIIMGLNSICFQIILRNNLVFLINLFELLELIYVYFIQVFRMKILKYFQDLYYSHLKLCRVIHFCWRELRNHSENFTNVQLTSIKKSVLKFYFKYLFGKYFWTGFMFLYHCFQKERINLLLVKHLWKVDINI